MAGSPDKRRKEHTMRFVKLSIAALFMVASASAMSASSTVVSKVERVLLDASDFAGCMVLLRPFPASELPNCAANWATLECLKEFPESTGSIASNKLAQAQLALVTGRSVKMRVTDTRIAHGYCFAHRIDVMDVRED